MKTVIYLDELLLTNFLAAAALLLGAGLFVCAAVQRPAADGGQCGSGSSFAGHSAAGAARPCSFRFIRCSPAVLL